jgi:hypothetical protein
LRFRMRAPGRRALAPVALAMALGLTAIPAAAQPVAAAEDTEADQIIRIAKRQLGDPWRYGADGPHSFDCSGLVIYSYEHAGDGAVIGNGRYRSARALYDYFRSKGKASRSDPRKGDLVVWGGGSHIGIYIGDGKAISTLTSGVKVHGVHAVTADFTAYLHTGMHKVPSGVGSTTTTATTTKIQIGDVRYIDGRVNLRAGPGTNYRILTTLDDRRKVTVVGKGQASDGRWWLKVTTDRWTGWVAKWLTTAS